MTSVTFEYDTENERYIGAVGPSESTPTCTRVYPHVATATPTSTSYADFVADQNCHDIGVLKNELEIAQAEIERLAAQILQVQDAYAKDMAEYKATIETLVKVIKETN